MVRRRNWLSLGIVKVTAQVMKVRFLAWITAWSRLKTMELSLQLALAVINWSVGLSRGGIFGMATFRPSVLSANAIIPKRQKALGIAKAGPKCRKKRIGALEMLVC